MTTGNDRKESSQHREQTEDGLRPHTPTLEEPVPMDSISMKKSADVEPAGTNPEAAKIRLKAEAPTYIKNLTPEERAAAEKALVRKIDIRLIPIIIIMYIMNYLDR